MQGLRFEPSEEQRRLVRVMVGFGVRQDDIATHLKIDVKTLRRHFRRELDRGMVEANLKVAQSLFAMATSGNNVAAAIFWMKARAGWSEKERIEHGIGPLTVISGVPRANDLSDDELARIAACGIGEKDAEPRRCGSYVIDEPADLTPEE